VIVAGAAAAALLVIAAAVGFFLWQRSRKQSSTSTSSLSEEAPARSTTLSTSEVTESFENWNDDEVPEEVQTQHNLVEEPDESFAGNRLLLNDFL
jgi:Flp pilus assembly protein TadB